MIVAIIEKGTESGKVQVRQFRIADSEAQAVTDYCDRYTPPRPEADYLGFDTGWAEYQEPSVGVCWAYDFDGQPPGLVPLDDTSTPFAPNHEVSEYDKKSRLISQKFYAIESGGVYSKLFEEHLFTYQGQRMMSETVNRYDELGTVVSSETFDFEQEKVGSSTFVRRKRR